MVTFSMDKQTQPNFMRDSYVYVQVGLCDHALILHKTVKYQRQYFDFFFQFSRNWDVEIWPIFHGILGFRHQQGLANVSLLRIDIFI